MKEHRITIEIDERGRLTAEAEGFSGDLCLKDLEALLRDLGPSQEVRRKPDAGAARATTRQVLKKEGPR